MLESLFQFLFEYRPAVFRQGDFRFAPPAGAPVAAAIVIAAVTMAFVSYRILLDAALIAIKQPGMEAPLRDRFTRLVGVLRPGEKTTGQRLRDFAP